MTVPAPTPEGGPIGNHRYPTGGRREAGRRDREAERRDREAARRRIDEIFGDVLPVTTDDERDPRDRPGFDAEFYRANRPPHHDR